jgi:hypothetical protein
VAATRCTTADRISPGYRIRELTALEEAEKVRDEVRRMREGEKGLVKNYRLYLKTLETEIKRESGGRARWGSADEQPGKSPLASVALRCLCELLTSVTHFNFSENIMGIVVARLNRRSWDSVSLVFNYRFPCSFFSRTPNCVCKQSSPCSATMQLRQPVPFFSAFSLE